MFRIQRLLLGGAAVGLLLAGSALAAAPDAPPLSASDRALIVQTLTDSDPGAAKLDDAALKGALIRYARTELGQRVRPTSIERMWSIEPARRDPAAEFAAAQAKGQLANWLKALSPTARPYQRLRAAETRYRSIVQAGGWAQLAGKAKLKSGDAGPEVGALRTRLATEGYGEAAAADPGRFDASLKTALAAFQAHHNLPEDGVLGADTRAALNVSAEARLAQIEANLERWRWLPRGLPAQRMVIDIGAARGALIRNHQPALRMNVVVGDPRHHTPMFASKINAVVFNPPWKVPSEIAAKEILPKARRDPGYLARNNFVLADGRVTQLPGPKNSLGQAKFDLPSPFGVYLHDTPGKSAFTRRNRALSHGCMRLEKPRELALEVLGPQGWTAERIDQAIAAGATQRVDLKTTVPLYVFYWTAMPDRDGGQVSFRADVYGWDRKLLEALDRAG